MRASLSDKKDARLEAIRAAQRQLVEAGVNLNDRVDVFRQIESQNVWLMFQPFPSIFGFYHVEERIAGIAINSKHPPSLQRFTAAHELGHHLLGHGSRVDLEDELERSNPDDLLEVGAQAFAAEFLMPLPLVNRLLLELGLRAARPSLTPELAYRLAVRLGASYSATISQLVGQQKITPRHAELLRTVSPLQIKKRLIGRRPETARSDVWVVDTSDLGRTIRPRISDEVHIYLPEAPSTGYVWESTTAPDGLVQIEDAHITNGTDDEFGAEGTRHVAYLSNVAGAGLLRLEKRRPWGSVDHDSEHFEITIEVVSRPTGESSTGLALAQWPALAAA